MRGIRLAELTELLHGPDFAAWWTDLRRAAQALDEARRRQLDLASQAELMELRSELAHRAAMDAFSRAGEAEDSAAAVSAAAQGLENRALEIVGRFEDQRLRTSDLWVRTGGAERIVEERREALAGAPGPAAEAAVAAAERAHRALAEEYAAEDAKRTRLWAEVEDTWARAFEKALLASERAAGSRRSRRESERLFEEAEARRGRSRQLRAEADAAAAERAAGERRCAELGRAAEERFGCVAGDAFLFFGRPDERRGAWAVALRDDPDGHAVAVTALEIYAVGPRGVAALEPARERSAAAEEADRRDARANLARNPGSP